MMLHEVRQKGGVIPAGAKKADHKAPAPAAPKAKDKKKKKKGKKARDEDGDDDDEAGKKKPEPVKAPEPAEVDDGLNEAPGWARRAAASRLLSGGLHGLKDASGESTAVSDGTTTPATASAMETQLAFLHDLVEFAAPAHLLDPAGTAAAAAAATAKAAGAGAGAAAPATAAASAAAAADSEAEELAALLPGMRLALWLLRIDHAERSVLAAALDAYCAKAGIPTAAETAAKAAADAAAKRAAASVPPGSAAAAATAAASTAAGAASGAGAAAAAAAKKRSEATAAAAKPGKAAGPEPLGDEVLMTVAAWTPAQSAALRSAFAAYLWHAGLVQDAMATASFLRFQPEAGVHAAASPSTKAAIVAAANTPHTAEAPAAAGAGAGASESKAAHAATPLTPEAVIATAVTKTVAATNGTLPPALRAILQVFRGVSNTLATPLRDAAAVEAEAKKRVDAGGDDDDAMPIDGGKAAAATAAGKGGSESERTIEAMRKRMADTSFRIRGGAEDAKAPAAGASVPKHVQKLLDELKEGRSDLPLIITEGMGWETRKAKHIQVTMSDTRARDTRARDTRASEQVLRVCVPPRTRILLHTLPRTRSLAPAPSHPLPRTRSLAPRHITGVGG